MIDWKSLHTLAEQASQRAYARYSGFAVGSAVLTEEGTMVPGANVENASYGLTNCAERTATFAAVAGGTRRLLAVAIYTPTDEPVAPCGACRQVLAEFGDDTLIVESRCRSGATVRYTLGELLPHAFRATE